MSAVLKREVRIAFSRHAQPLWIRITKWIVLLSLAARARRHPRLWRWVVAMPLAGIMLHMVYRTKTKGWTQPWGGWNDLAAGDDTSIRN
ncbi:MAG TPA: hypothetical protein VGE07_06885 [Herpetosiphonaceae bacterium]